MIHLKVRSLKEKILLLVFLIWAPLLLAQSLLPKKPRLKAYNELPGCYDLVFSLKANKINRGDNILIKVFFSGYGEISNAKLHFIQSSEFLEIEDSYILSGINYDKRKGISWGGSIIPFETQLGHIINFSGGLSFPNWIDSPTIFLDANPRDFKSNVIITEDPIGGSAPAEYHLKTKEDIEAGEHFVTFTFTYYNGQEWKGVQQKVNFTVRNFYEKNDWVNWLAALIAIILACEPIIKLYRYLHQRFRQLIPDEKVNKLGNQNNPLKKGKK